MILEEIPKLSSCLKVELYCILNTLGQNKIISKEVFLSISGKHVRYHIFLDTIRAHPRCKEEKYLIWLWFVEGRSQ